MDLVNIISIQYIKFVFHIKRSSISNLEELFLKLIFFVNWAYSLYSIIHNISCIALITWLTYGDTKRPFWNFCTFLSLSLQIALPVYIHYLGYQKCGYRKWLGICLVNWLWCTYSIYGIHLKIKSCRRHQAWARMGAGELKYCHFPFLFFFSVGAFEKAFIGR